MVDQKNKIIVIVGLPGTGKSALAHYMSEGGVPRVSFGSIVNNAVAEAGLELNIENERSVREKLRLDPSGDKVAEEVINQVNVLLNSGQHRILVDGLGSWDTYKRLRHEYHSDLIVVALTARRYIRHRRLAERKELPLTAAEVDVRDYDEIETLNKGGVIAIADYYLFDNGSLEQLHIQIDDLLREIEF